MNKIKKFFTTVGAVLLAILTAIFLLDKKGKVNNNPELDAEKGKLEDDLQEINDKLKDPVEDLKPDEVEDYWKKR